MNLITNNKDKINILKRNNIKINKVIPTKPSLNSFNIQYLASRSKKMNYNIKNKYTKGSWYIHYNILIKIKLGRSLLGGWSVRYKYKRSK